MTASNDDKIEETVDQETVLNQPGLARLREAVATYARRQAPEPPRLRHDGLAGLNTAIASVPDGMASGLLAGVNPVYGLYACILGPIAGGLFASAQADGDNDHQRRIAHDRSGPLSLPAAERDVVLVLLVVMVGVLQISFGLLRMGRLTRFVSYLVMTGFLAGISVLLVLSQLPTVTGYQPVGINWVTQTLDLLVNLGQVHLPTLGLAALTLFLAFVLPKIGLRTFGTLIAIFVPSVLAFLFDVDVARVRNVGEIDGEFPDLEFPSPFDLTFELVTGAAAIAAVTLAQGARVSQSVPNPDGSRRRPSRDFIAQGTANVASGLFQGIPVGGSLGATAMNVTSGARTRWSVIFAGLWMAIIVVAFWPSLSSRCRHLRRFHPCGHTSYQAVGSRFGLACRLAARLVAVTTFVATLLLPLQAAVGLGAVLSALIYLYQSSMDVVVVEQILRPDGGGRRTHAGQAAGKQQGDRSYVYGQLYYAGAATLDRLLPKPNGAESPVVVLRLRGQPNVGATLSDVLSRYADQLKKRNGRIVRHLA